ncbi:MAG TPA: glycine zipper 2TM domain-containing protein [Steroidobacter sp.]|uniref:glycine zipper 2TM domain-containing protein n=1 Tax=Steroidobacter sp. TaxID=1978227 RepID=UPI002ED7EAE0
MFTRLLKPLLGALLCASIFASTPALSDPPDHAPAHGWRKKHDPRYVGYTGREWDRDYGILAGSCRRKEIGTVVGAVIGGAIGSQIGDGTGRTVAIIVGSVLGGVIGREIGEELDEGDRGCFGHALELAEPGHAVRWINERTNVSYVLTPLVTKDSKNCRRFKLEARAGKKRKKSEGRACRDGDGVWRMG